jgi:hypothetical protein
MADFAFNTLKGALGGGLYGGATRTLVWHSSASNATPSTLKVCLVKGDGAGRQDDDTVSVFFAAAAEYAGTNYARKTLTARTVTVDDGNDRSELDDTADITWTALGPDTICNGILVYWDPNGSDSDSTNVPLLYFDLNANGISFNGNGGDITLQWNADGLVTIS